MKFSIIIPAYNEEENIGKVIDSIGKHASRYINEIIVIDDGSTDNTAKVAKLAGATVLKHKQNRGVGAAIRTGIEYARARNYDACVVIGGDGQDDPSEIFKLIQPILKDGYDLIQGSRYLGNSVNMPLFRKLTTKLFTKTLNTVCNFPYTDASNGFRAFKTNIFEEIDIWKDGLDRYELEPYILIKAVKARFKVKEVPITKFFPKETSYSKMKPFLDWFNIAKPIIREIFNGIAS